MALVKNIGGIETVQAASNADILLAAFNNADEGGVQVQTLSTPVTPVQAVYPSSGGNVDGAPSGSTTTANIAVIADGGVTSPESPAAALDESAGGVPVQKCHPLLLIGVGLGAMYLLNRHSKSVGALKKKSLVVPAVIVGGVALWYFMSKKGSSATTAPSTGTTSTIEDQERTALLGYYAGQEKQTAAINAADSETLRKWYMVYTQFWSVPGSQPYAYDTNGNPTTNWDASLGKWWELYSQSKGF